MRTPAAFASPATLIPRPDTECSPEQALARLPVKPRRPGFQHRTGADYAGVGLRATGLRGDRGRPMLRWRYARGTFGYPECVRIRQSCWFSALSGSSST